jgi:hypothetical protein
MAFRYPGGWEFYPMRLAALGGYTTLGYVSSAPLDMDSVCPTVSPGGCDPATITLPEHSVVILIVDWSQPLHDPVAFWDAADAGVREQLAGMPALFTTTSTDENQVTLAWKVARPTDVHAWVQVEARIRGPGIADLRDDVERLVASLHFLPAPQPLTADPNARAEIAKAAVLSIQATDVAYSCFPTHIGGARSATVTQLPETPHLTRPLPVTCSMAFDATDIGFWRLDLKVSWSAGADRTAGSTDWIYWLPADGSKGSHTRLGELPPAYL